MKLLFAKFFPTFCYFFLYAWNYG